MAAPEGYGTNEGYEEYAAAMGWVLPADNPDTEQDESDIGTARLRGSSYIDAVYGPRFPGEPVDGIDQDRAWPRVDAVDMYGNTISGIPTRVVHASYEATHLELENPGSLAILISENEKVKRLKAGSVEIEYAGAADASTSAVAGAAPMSTTIEGLLWPLINSGSAVVLPAILVV